MARKQSFINIYKVMTIYFQYQLKQVGYGEKIGPASFLPQDSETGRTDANDILYGKADIDSLECIADFNPVEIAKYDYPFSPEELFVEKVKDGFDTGNGYRLAMGDNDRNQWTSLLVLYRESNAPDTTELQIADIDGNLHTVTLAQFRQIAIGLGQAYASLWTAYRSAVS